MTRKQDVVAILEPIHQSQPCITIHHTYNERLDGLADMKWLIQSLHAHSWFET